MLLRRNFFSQRFLKIFFQDIRVGPKQKTGNWLAKNFFWKKDRVQEVKTCELTKNEAFHEQKKFFSQIFWSKKNWCTSRLRWKFLQRPTFFVRGTNTFTLTRKASCMFIALGSHRNSRKPRFLKKSAKKTFNASLPCLEKSRKNLRCLKKNTSSVIRLTLFRLHEQGKFIEKLQDRRRGRKNLQKISFYWKMFKRLKLQKRLVK